MNRKKLIIYFFFISTKKWFIGSNISIIEMDTFCEQKEVNYLFCFIIDFLGLDAAKDGLSQNAPKRSLSQLGGL